MQDLVSFLRKAFSVPMKLKFLILEEADFRVEQENHPGDDDSGLARVERTRPEREGGIQQPSQEDERSSVFIRYGIQSMTKQCNGRPENLGHKL